MKKTIFAFLSILTLAGTARAQGWVKLNTGTTASLGSISVSKSDTLWAGGAAILNSTDGGTTWDSLKGLAGSIYFLDGTSGFLFPGGSSLFKTTDAGGHWKPITTQLPKITVMSFTGRDSGCIMDGAFTTDGGDTWLLSTNDEPLPTMHGMAFADARHGYMVGDPAYSSQGNWPQATSFARTTDGGANWHVVYTGDTLDKSHTGMYQTSWGIAAPSIDTIIAVGLQIGRSTDGGNTWDTIPYPGADWYNGFLAVTFPDARHGTAVGTGGWILHTTDAGLTWTRQNSGVTVDLVAVSFTDSLHGFATGDRGTVLMTANGGLSWVKISPLSSNTIQGTIYPQPTTAKTSLAYMLPQAQRASLDVHDMTGRKVEDVLADAYQPAGLTSVSIDTSTLASGTYTYVLQTEKYYSTGKIEVIH